MPTRIRTSCARWFPARLSVALLLCCLGPALAATQAQEPKPPATSDLTPEQNAELKDLNKQGNNAYSKGDLQTAAKLFQQGLDKAMGLHDDVMTAKFLHNLGIVYNRLNQFDKALEYHSRALATREKLGNSQDIAGSLYNLGEVYDSSGQYNKAHDAYNRALTLYETLGDQRGIATSLNNLGLVANALGQFDKALEYHSHALAVKEKIGDPQLIASSLNNLGLVYKHLSQFDKALDYYNRALAISEKLGNQRGIAFNLHNLGNVYISMGRFDEALDYNNRALAIRENLGNPQEIGASLNNLGLVYMSVGQFDKALDYLSRALTIKEKIGNPQDVANSLHSLSLVYMSVGNFDKALDYLSHALALYEKLDNSQEVASSLNNLGLVYKHLGQFDKALDYHSRALALYKIIDNPQDIATSLNNLGLVYDSLGQFDKALDYYNRALGIQEKLNNLQNIATSLNNLGNVYISIGQFDKALDYHGRALTIKEKIGNPRLIASSLSNVGNVYHNLGQFTKALECHSRALAIREKFGNPEDLAISLTNMGNVYCSLDQLGEAETKYVAARRQIEAFSYQVSDPSQVGVLQETFHGFYERYARLLRERKRPQDALEMLEAGRGQGLARQVAFNQRGDLLRIFTLEERQTLDQHIDALNLALARQHRAQQMAETAPGASRAILRQQAEEAQERAHKAEQEYALFRNTLFARHPDLQRLATAPPARFADMQKLVRAHPDTLYLEWGVADDKTTLLFALSAKGGLKSLVLSTGEKTLYALAKRWRAQLPRAGGRGVDLVNGDTPTESANLAAVEEKKLAKQAYNLLFGDAARAGLLAPGRYKRLVLAGSGPMLEMPLAALCDPQGKRLIERYPLSQILSLSLLLWCPNSLKPKASLMCIADPTGAKEGVMNKQASIAQGTGIKTVDFHNPPPRHAFRTGFVPLPGARAEGKAVKGLFAGSRLLLGPEASEETVTKLLPDFAILHFATHGYVVPHAILSSGLVLAEESDADRPDSKFDGLLTARKIMSLPLSTRLAVLSACDTGRGTVSGGEGLLGLAWAFRAAGCPALVASQWQVDDAATSALMVAFYKNLKAHMPKDDALREAMLTVKAKQASPYYWAAFQLIGDASPISALGGLSR